MHFTWIYFHLLSGFAFFTKTTEIVRRGPNDERACDTRLMDSEAKLPNSAFSASSVRRNLAEFRPYHARLFGSLYAGREHTSGRAWCPNGTVQTALNEWIQVDFASLVIIGTIFTAGRGDGNGAEFMPSFILHYQREDGGPWYEHSTHELNERVILANIDSRNTARHMFDPVVIARRLRIYPYSATSQHLICLRFALKGCPFPDGITEYLATEGNHGFLGPDRNQRIDFRDILSDARMAVSQKGAASGLGKLVDNKAYLGNITHDVEKFPYRHHFVGWEGVQQSPIKVVFKFDKPRNFSRLCIFTYTSSWLRVGLFSRATIDFVRSSAQPTADSFRLAFQTSTDNFEFKDLVGQSSWREAEIPDRFTVLRNPQWDGAVIVNVPLQGHIAEEVVLQLFPSDKWLLISEIQFISEPQIVASSSSSSAAGEVADVKDAEAESFKRNGYLQPEVPDITVTADRPLAIPISEMDHHHYRVPLGRYHQSDGDNPPASPVTQQPHDLVRLHQLRAPNGGGRTTFVIIIVVSLLLSALCVVLVFCLCVRLQQSRHRHKSLKKANTTPDLMLGIGTCPTRGAQCGIRRLYQQTLGQLSPAAGNDQAPPAPGYIFTATGHHPAGSGPILTTPGTQSSPLQVLSSSGLFSASEVGTVGTGFHALPSSGAHNFASLTTGDFSSDCQRSVAAMHQLAMMQQQQHQFYSMGLIHPATGGDTTTDSGSLYTTPPGICPASHVSLQFSGLPHKVSPSALSSSDDDDDDNNDSRVVTGQEGPRTSVDPAENSSMTSSASEGAAGDAKYPTLLPAGCVGDETEKAALLKSGVSNSGDVGGLKRKRPKRQRHRALPTSRTARDECKKLTPTSGLLHEESTQSRADSGVGSSRTDTATKLQQMDMFTSGVGSGGGGGVAAAARLMQPSATQPFPNLAGSDTLGTEYASTSLFGSSTASNHNGMSTGKKGSSPLIGTTRAQYPFLMTSHFADISGCQSSAALGAPAHWPSGSFQFYQPILLPAQQAHMLPSGALGDSQLGGLVQQTPFLPQGLLHNHNPPPVAGYNSEATVVSAPACWSTLTIPTTEPTSTGYGSVRDWSSPGFKSSSGTALPPVPSIPPTPNPYSSTPYHYHHQHHHYHLGGCTDGTGSSRLSVYSVCK